MLCGQHSQNTAELVGIDSCLFRQLIDVEAIWLANKNICDLGINYYLKRDWFFKLRKISIWKNLGF
jgi:hypothetical protein